MQKNYLILAHKNPQQLARMVNALNDGQAKFFIHIDANAAIEPFEALLEGGDIVLLKERERCVWGDFSIVRATIRLMEEAAQLGSKGFFILMSGQDYPIVDAQSLNVYLQEHQDTNFIDYLPLEEKWRAKMVKDKVEHYHILHSARRGDSNCYAPFYHSSLFQKGRTLWHLLKGRLSVGNFKRLCRLPKREPLFAQQYAGSQFWAFCESTFYEVLGYIRAHSRELELYYEYTSSSDEVFFHTILLNMEHGAIKPSLTYVNWERKGVPLPVLFKREDFGELRLQKGKFFARKFDVDVDEGILDELDKVLNS
nr:beta-1,6-N-acetylglucosaminyltransferase [uncultured Capnocytophaga sp.]